MTVPSSASLSQVDKAVAKPCRNFGNSSQVVPQANSTERDSYFFYDC